MDKNSIFLYDERITLETAKLLKKKKFKPYVDSSYIEYHTTKIDPEYPEGGGPFGMKKGEIEVDKQMFKNGDQNCDYTNKDYTMYARPTQDSLVYWLLFEHNIQVYAYSHTLVDGKYNYFIAHVSEGKHGGVNRDIHDPRDEEFHTKEAALEAGIQYALNLIK